MTHKYELCYCAILCKYVCEILEYTVLWSCVLCYQCMQSCFTICVELNLQISKPLMMYLFYNMRTAKWNKVNNEINLRWFGTRNVNKINRIFTKKTAWLTTGKYQTNSFDLIMGSIFYRRRGSLKIRKPHQFIKLKS